MPKLTVEQRRHRNDQRLINHSPTRRGPIAPEQGHLLVKVLAVFLTIAGFLGMAGGFYLMVGGAGQPGDSEGFTSLIKILAIVIVPAFTVAIAYDTIAIRQFFRKQFIARICHWLGRPLPLSTEEVELIIETSKLPGSPLLGFLVEWLAANEKGLLTEREYLAVIRWKEESTNIYWLSQKDQHYKAREENIRSMLHDGELGAQVKAIKDQRSLQNTTVAVGRDPEKKRL